MVDHNQVWANGHEKAKFTVREVDTNGQPVQGRIINLSADPPNIVTIESSNPFTDQNGEIEFTATSTELGKIKFTATDQQDTSLIDSIDVEFNPRKIVVLFLGIRTSLQCNPLTGECDPGRDSDNFATIRTFLQSSRYGFQKEEIQGSIRRG